MSDTLVRRAVASDEAFLWEMLAQAASMEMPVEEAIVIARRDPHLAGYVAGWGRPGDLGVIASEDGAPIGAAWLRPGRPGLPDAPTAHDGSCELAIATRAAARGRGIGGRMLRELIAIARAEYRAIVLSVRDHNPARRLYERFGFRTEREITNRVGGRSYFMRLELE